ncbi:hypothetical protein MHYP_G00250350 [Metynnis hypsauchen]
MNCWKPIGKRSIYMDQSDLNTDIRSPKTLTAFSPPAPVSEMERSRVTLVTLVCVLFSRISGAEVQLRVRRGDDATLYCDRSWTGINKVWFRNSSNKHQPHLIITEEDLKNGTFPRYSFLWNPSIRTQDLLVKNVTESDLGLYRCGGHEKSVLKRKAGAHVVLSDVYYYGNRITRLSLFDTQLKRLSKLDELKLKVLSGLSPQVLKRDENHSLEMCFRWAVLRSITVRGA